MIDYLGMVREFHEKYGHYIADKPERHDTVPPIVHALRQRLIAEEFEEFKDAEIRLEIADSLADLLYVVFGTCVSYGIPIDEVFREVHESNMTKSTALDKYGKTIKGSEWKPPNLAKVMKLESAG
jgi:predicted HAD superfamily Cof-like phosphohydrolase